jgi:chromatin segregation and condensation protein Rec8/ScpA/Scc1 (kleisin family)
MAAIALLPTTEPDARASDFYAARWRDTPYAQGIEGRQLSKKAEEVDRQWRERAEVFLMPRSEADESSYEHVPASQVFYVKTRYVYLGQGRPRPFDLDGE